MSFYLDKKDFKNLFEMLKNLTSKNSQSSVIILQLLKFTTNKIYNSIEITKKPKSLGSISSENDYNEVMNDNSTNYSNCSSKETSALLKDFLETLKTIIVDNDKFLFSINNKKKDIFIKDFLAIYNSICSNTNPSGNNSLNNNTGGNSTKYDELKQLIVDFEIDEDEDSVNSKDITIKPLNKYGETNKLKSEIIIPSMQQQDAYSSHTSTKQNKLEVTTTNANLNSSLRKFHVISPVNKFTISNFMNNMNKDNLKFIKDPKYPFARIAGDATLTINQINKVFINEMKSLGFIITGSEYSEFVKAEKKHFDFFQSFINCFKSDNNRNTPNSSNITSLYINTKFSETNKFERLIEISGTSGKKELITYAIEQFFKKIRICGKKLRPLRVQDVNAKLLVKPEKSNSHEKLPVVK